MIISTVLVALAGGLGAICRLVIDRALRHRFEDGFPGPTMIINLSGSLLLGLLAGFVAAGLPPAWETVVGTGFLGGYTTLSAASVGAVRLLQQRRWTAALVVSLGTLLPATALCLVGFLLGSAIG